MEGCNREEIVKSGKRDCAASLFLLIRIRFHKDPHDCLITRGAQRAMRRRGEAESSGDTMNLINSCLPSSRLLSLFY